MLEVFGTKKNDTPEPPPAIAMIVSALGAQGEVDEDAIVLAVTGVMNGCSMMDSGVRDGHAVGSSRGVNVLLEPGRCVGMEDFCSALMKPVWLRDSNLRRRARAADSKKINHGLDMLDRSLGLSRPDAEPGLAVHIDRMSERHIFPRCLELLRRPVFYLRDPDARTLERGLTESLDKNILVDLFGSSLFAELVREKVKTASVSKAEGIIRLLHGGHRQDSGLSDERHDIAVERCSGSFVGSIGSDTLATILDSRCEPALGLIKKCVIHRVAPQTYRLTRAQVEEGLEAWDRAVADRISRDVTRWGMRYDGIATQCWPQFTSYARDLQGLAEDVVGDEKVAFLRPLWGLPSRILSALGNVVREVTSDDFARTAHYAESVARRIVVEHYNAALEGGARTAAREYDDTPDARMLEKLRRRGPMQFRDLLRMYSTQRKRIHQPVLDRLMEDDLVFLNADGLLEARRVEADQLRAG